MTTAYIDNIIDFLCRAKRKTYAGKKEKKSLLQEITRTIYDTLKTIWNIMTLTWGAKNLQAKKAYGKTDAPFGQ